MNRQWGFFGRLQVNYWTILNPVWNITPKNYRIRVIDLLELWVSVCASGIIIYIHLDVLGTKGNWLYVCLDFLFVCGFTSHSGIFTHLETSPSTAKGFKFWPMLGTHGHWAVFFSVPHLLWLLWMLSFIYARNSS